MRLIPPYLHIWDMPGILAIPKNAQNEHEITFSKVKVSRESQSWVSLPDFLEFPPVEEVEF